MPHDFNLPDAGFKSTLTSVFISIIRRLEKNLSPKTFCRLVRPAYLMRSLLNSVFKKAKIGPALPDFLNAPKNLSARINDRTNLYFNRVLLNFPDRLGEPKWMANCQFDGLEFLEAARRKNRPVVLAFYHFGAFPILHCWLRGGLKFPVVAMVGGNAAMRANLERLQDQFHPLPDLPVIMYLDQLRELVRLFSAGNILYMAIDSPTGKQMRAPFCDGWDFEMATGAIRFASRYQADLVPCVITNEKNPLHYRVTIGRPAPAEFLADEADWPRAGKHLLDEMMPVFKARPDQCWEAMTKRLKRKTNGAVEK